MSIPTQFDRQIAGVDDLAASVLLRLRVYHRAGPDRSPEGILNALENYNRAVRALIGEEENE